MSRNVLILAAAISCLLVGCSQTTDPIGPADSTPSPDAPRGVTAAPLSGTKVFLSWNVSSQADKYTVYRGTVSGARDTFLGSVRDTFFIDTGLAAGTEYIYTVRSWHDGAFSATATPETTITLPPAPAGLVVGPLNDSVSVITWQTSRSATVYTVFWGSANATALDSLGTAQDTFYVDSAAVGDSSYQYAVAARNQSGVSVTGAAVQVTMPPAVPAAPSGIALDPSRIGYVDMSWGTVPGADSYRVYRGSVAASDSLESMSDTVFEDSSVLSSTLYYYGVSACNESGCSPISGPDTVRTFPDWNPVGGAGISAGPVRFTCIGWYMDTLYVAFQDAGEVFRPRVMRSTGDTWEAVGVSNISKGRGEFLSLDVASGTPYLAFKDWDAQGRATLAMFDGGNWSTVGEPGFSDSLVDHVSLCVDAGIPYVAFQDWADSGRATVMKYVSGTWTAVGDKGFSDSTARYISLQVDNGIPYVAFRDQVRDNKATVMKYESAAWSVVGTAGFTTGGALYTGLVVDSSTLYLAFRDEATNDGMTVMRYDGSAWAAVGTAGFPGNTVDFPAVTVRGGVVYAAFYDYTLNAGRAMMNDGGSWVDIGTGGFVYGSVAFLDVAVQEGLPVVSFQDGTVSNRLTVMRYY